MIAFYSLWINGNFGLLLDAPKMPTVTFYKKKNAYSLKEVC